MARFELDILGCGSATSTVRHLPSSQVLNIRDNLYMIDCGEGTQLQMRRMQLKFSRLNHIFISHLHGDHCFGLPGLLSTLALLGKTGVITVHIFNDGADQFGRILEYFCREMPYKVEFNVISTKGNELIYEDDAITVTTIPLRHRIPAVGFLFREKPKKRHIIRDMTDFYAVPHFKMEELRQGADFVTDEGKVVPNSVLTTPAEPSISYAYCSDTSFHQKVIDAVKGVDWLYHETTYGKDMQSQAKSRFHSTTIDAATVAKEAGVGHLVMGHYSSRYCNLEELLDEAKTIFPNTILGDEGMRIDLLQDLK